MLRALALVAALFPALPGGAAAQASDPLFPLGRGSPIVTLDQDRLFEESAFGQRVLADLEAAARALAEENRRLEDELSAEERALTERRSTLSPEEFRALADEFDARVEEIRRTQEAKNRALVEYRDAEGQRFFDLAAAPLRGLVRELGAVAVLDSRVIFLAAEQIDITDAAIARIDAEIGDGAEGAPDAEVAPDDGGAGEQDQPPAQPPESGPPLELPDPSAPE